ncbi:MAG TPA: hypothetical protein VLK29_00370 [Luteimonas sp.]|nr:hypothetical protein [Luteimonas sp.]
MPRIRFPLFLLGPLLALAAAPTHAQGARDVDKVNGAITAKAGEAHGSLSTVNGSITIEDGASAQGVETVNGGIRAGDDVRARALGTVNGAIRVGTGAVLDGDVETVNGSIFVDRGGRIGGDVVTVNGAIGLVATEVQGGLETVNGDVTVGLRSHVHGGLRVHKPTSKWMPVTFSRRTPRVIVGPGAAVDGALVFEREVTLYVHESARIGAVSGATAVRYAGTTAPPE